MKRIHKIIMINSITVMTIISIFFGYAVIYKQDSDYWYSQYLKANELNTDNKNAIKSLNDKIYDLNEEIIQLKSK